MTSSRTSVIVRGATAMSALCGDGKEAHMELGEAHKTNRYQQVPFQSLLVWGSKRARQRPRCDVSKVRGTNWKTAWWPMRVSPSREKKKPLFNCPTWKKFTFSEGGNWEAYETTNKKSCVRFCAQWPKQSSNRAGSSSTKSKNKLINSFFFFFKCVGFSCSSGKEGQQSVSGEVKQTKKNIHNN